MADDEPEGYRIPIPQALVLPDLIMGTCPRTPILMALAIPGLSLISRNFLVIGAAIAAFAVAFFVLSRLGKYDPIFFEVFDRANNLTQNGLHISAQPSIISPAAPSPVHQ